MLRLLILSCLFVYPNVIWTSNNIVIQGRLGEVFVQANRRVSISPLSGQSAIQTKARSVSAIPTLAPESLAEPQIAVDQIAVTSPVGSTELKGKTLKLTSLAEAESVYRQKWDAYQEAHDQYQLLKSRYDNISSLIDSYGRQALHNPSPEQTRHQLEVKREQMSAYQKMELARWKMDQEAETLRRAEINLDRVRAQSQDLREEF